MKDSSSPSFIAGAFTDLMASLAVVFILLTVVFIRQASQASKRGKQAVRSGLSEVLSRHNLPLKQDPLDPLALTVSVGEDVLKFALNSAELSRQGAAFLDGFVPSFVQQLCVEPIHSSLDAVTIEGYTDRSGEGDVEGEGTRHNIRLSQSRSYAVLDRALRTVRRDPVLTECLLNLLSATGRGSRSPIFEAGEYNADLSRRVEIKIRVKSAEQRSALLSLGTSPAQGSD